MPIYEYQCADCGGEFEKMVRFSAADERPECPRCESRSTRKKLSAFASPGGSLAAAPATSGSGCGSGGGFT